ncbi:MAG: hypothetical protein A2X28_03015 [Elusimicrobia bacterium GWA2_56_46]|nr:MAG: hypothetical protein A2X28_03015 [Elusimicrobia bacterium GWA2_56_46]OGR54199.1 MAG: hypothetical protein A2X39_08960 [Elusimicrobia bacterium GWC2_56_31]HBB68267.1 PqqD family protein [Elusimicrobiota bacterium]HBW21777.1 PqqD family protein [Elusimicrobiota bacterium]
MPAEKKNPSISEAVTWRKTGEEAVILNLETSEYYSTNGAGAFIWELLNSGRNHYRIAEALAAEYGIPVKQAAADTAEFLNDLRKLKILDPEAGR